MGFLCCGGSEEEPERVFGADIEKMSRQDLDDNGIPIILKQCAQYLRVNGMQAEGIFRKTSSTVKMKELRTKYNDGGTVDFRSFGGHFMAANVMKTFLRELRKPLMTWPFYPFAQKFKDDNNDSKLDRIRDKLMTLPGRNLTVLRALLSFLHEVNEHGAKNGMSTKNVAILFAPNLFWGKGAGPTSSKIQPVAEADKIKQFLEFMFEHSDRLFKDLTKEDYVETTL
eukprot:m.189782 g.189782  ORF g.189782 m.189782 type:complete len:226 (-) comp18531_c0_seq2:285-962(-)